MRLSSDVALAAAQLPGLELDDPDQIRFYNVADRKPVAATLIPIRQQLHPHGAPLAIKQGPSGATRSMRVAIWSREGEPRSGQTQSTSRRLGA